MSNIIKWSDLVKEYFPNTSDKECEFKNVKVTIGKYNILNEIIPNKYVNDKIIDLPLYLNEVHNIKIK